MLVRRVDAGVTYNPEIHHRRSIRAREYDYSRPGSYFVTICTWGRDPVLGEIFDGVMRVNAAGALVLDVWNGLPERFAGVALDAFVVMPNHVHGIVVIGGVPDGSAGARELGRACPARPPYRNVP